MNQLEIEEIKKITGGCPAQWEIELQDKRKLFARYRGGNFTIELVSENENQEDEEIYLWVSNDLGDGYMSTLDMVDHLKIAIKNIPIKE